MAITIRVFPQHNSVGARRNRAMRRYQQQLVAQQRYLQQMQYQQQLTQQSMYGGWGAPAYGGYGSSGYGMTLGTGIRRGAVCAPAVNSWSSAWGGAMSLPGTVSYGNSWGWPGNSVTQQTRWGASPNAWASWF